ncbi:MAG: hypothetical protein K6F72_00080 [Bacteroidales bacterium]|nr:hypothetical protein [Bacteroidales bacterium]
MAEKETPKSKRELVLERLTAKYPDSKWEDDEALMGQVENDYADYERRIADYAANEAKMEEMFRNDPKSAQYLADLAAGKDPWIAVVERLGIDGITELMNDPEKKAAYEEANNTYAARVAKEKELEAEYERNLAESQAVREELDAQYGAEVVDAALAVIDQMTKDAIMGKVTREALEMALKVVRHDAEVENARSEGVLAGKNAKIEEKLRTQQGGDGLPAMGGSSAAPSPRKENKSIFDVARSAE